MADPALAAHERAEGSGAILTSGFLAKPVFKTSFSEEVLGAGTGAFIPSQRTTNLELERTRGIRLFN
jgi:hypothetical protein